MIVYRFREARYVSPASGVPRRGGDGGPFRGDTRRRAARLADSEHVERRHWPSGRVTRCGYFQASARLFPWRVF